jgi:hypothetical protein
MLSINQKPVKTRACANFSNIGISRSKPATYLQLTICERFFEWVVWCWLLLVFLLKRDFDAAEGTKISEDI